MRAASSFMSRGRGGSRLADIAYRWLSWALPSSQHVSEGQEKAHGETGEIQVVAWTPFDSPMHRWKNVQSLTDMGDTQRRPSDRADQFEKGWSPVRPKKRPSCESNYYPHEQQINDGFGERRAHISEMLSPTIRGPLVL